MSTKLLQREIIEGDGLTISRGTQDISDLLSTVHYFIRAKKVEFKGRNVKDILKTIEKFFYFEESSVWSQVTGTPSSLNPDPLVEDVYYGLAYVPKKQEQEAVEYFHETLVPLLDELAPEGFAFMSHEGSSSDYGFYDVRNEG